MAEESEAEIEEEEEECPKCPPVGAPAAGRQGAVDKRRAPRDAGGSAATAAAAATTTRSAGRSIPGRSDAFLAAADPRACRSRAALHGRRLAGMYISSAALLADGLGCGLELVPVAGRERHREVAAAVGRRRRCVR